MNKINMTVFLFLDDVREPEHVFEYTKQEMFLKQKWEVVRNFDEFKNYLKTGKDNIVSLLQSFQTYLHNNAK